MLHFQVHAEFQEFEVGPDPFGRTWRVEFKWLLTAISLRHSDSIDVKFVLRSDDTKIAKIIALRHPDLLELSEKTGHPLTDPWCSRLGVMHLKMVVETGEDLEKSLITPSLEQLGESDARLFANAAA